MAPHPSLIQGTAPFVVAKTELLPKMLLPLDLKLDLQTRFFEYIIKKKKKRLKIFSV